MTGYRLRPKALQDLTDIADFIAADNPGRAVSFIDELMAVCADLAAHPRAYQRRDDLAEGLRQAVHGRYLILFSTDDAGVVIERLIHGARRLDNLL